MGSHIYTGNGMDTSLIAPDTAPHNTLPLDTDTMSLAAYPGAVQVADVLDWGFSLYRHHPGLTWPLTILGSLPLVLAFTAFYYFFAILKFSPLSGLPRSIPAWSFCLTVLIFWRTILLGAQTIAVDRIFTGYPALMKSSLSGALKKGISLCAFAAAHDSFFILSSIVLFIPYLLLGGSFYPALSLVTLEGLSPLQALNTLRTLPGFSRRCFYVHLLILLLWVMVAVNIMVGLYLLLGLLHSVFNINISYWQIFFSLSNRTYLFLVLGLGFLLTEPLRAASGWLLYNDYRVRKEGHDLRQMADRLLRGEGR